MKFALSKAGGTLFPANHQRGPSGADVFWPPKPSWAQWTGPGQGGFGHGLVGVANPYDPWGDMGPTRPYEVPRSPRWNELLARVFVTFLGRVPLMFWSRGFARQLSSYN